MSVRSALLFATLASLAALMQALPVPVLPKARSESSRYRRKVAQLDVGSTPMDYMIQLKSDLSDERGTPKNYTQDPTSVWCFMDKGRPARNDNDHLNCFSTYENFIYVCIAL